MLKHIIFALALIVFPALIGMGTAWYQQHSVPIVGTPIPQAQSSQSSNQQNNTASLLQF